MAWRIESNMTFENGPKFHIHFHSDEPVMVGLRSLARLPSAVSQKLGSAKLSQNSIHLGDTPRLNLIAALHEHSDIARMEAQASAATTNAMPAKAEIGRILAILQKGRRALLATAVVSQKSGPIHDVAPAAHETMPDAQPIEHAAQMSPSEPSSPRAIHEGARASNAISPAAISAFVASGKIEIFDKAVADLDPHAARGKKLAPELGAIEEESEKLPIADSATELHLASHDQPESSTGHAATAPVSHAGSSAEESEDEGWTILAESAAKDTPREAYARTKPRRSADSA